MNNINLSLKAIKHTSPEETGIILKALNLVVQNLIWFLWLHSFRKKKSRINSWGSFPQKIKQSLNNYLEPYISVSSAPLLSFSFACLKFEKNRLYKCILMFLPVFRSFVAVFFIYAAFMFLRYSHNFVSNKDIEITAAQLT